jgi:hypothetical protein
MFSMGSPLWMVIGALIVVVGLLHKAYEREEPQPKKVKRTLRRVDPGESPDDTTDGMFTPAALNDLESMFKEERNGYH